MSHEVRTISPDATLKDAAQMMDDLDVGALPVCDGNRLTGIITDRDIVVRSISAGQDPNSTRVTDAMTASSLHYCFEDQDVREAAEMMKRNQIRRVPVLDRNKRLVGMVSLGDIAVDTSGDSRITAEVTKDVSKQHKAA